MSETKQETSFLDKVLQKSIAKPIVANGKDKSKYTGVYLLRSVQCQNCQMLYVVPPNAILWKYSAIELQTFGEDIHVNGTRENKQLCANPKLIILWDNAYILSELLG